MGRGSGGEGGGKKKKKGVEIGSSWWSWRGAFKRRQREIAAQNVEELCATATNKGCVVRRPYLIVFANIAISRYTVFRFRVGLVFAFPVCVYSGSGFELVFVGGKLH